MLNSTDDEITDFIQGQITFLTVVVAGLKFRELEIKGDVRAAIEKIKEQRSPCPKILTGEAQAGWNYQYDTLINQLIDVFNNVNLFTNEERIERE